MTPLREATEHDATYERTVRESYPSLAAMMRERYGVIDRRAQTGTEREAARRITARDARTEKLTVRCIERESERYVATRRRQRKARR